LGSYVVIVFIIILYTKLNKSIRILAAVL